MMTSSRRALLFCSIVPAIVMVLLAASPAIAGNAVLNLVLVLDGLRPDAITAEETPHLWRLRQEGVNFANGHAVFPTVTRANATAIATGTYPQRNGIFGNTLYVREVDPNRAFGNDDHKNLLRLDAVTGGGPDEHRPALEQLLQTAPRARKPRSRPCARSCLRVRRVRRRNGCGPTPFRRSCNC